MTGKRWVMVYEGSPGSLQVTAAQRLAVGDTVEIGREGDLAIGVTVPTASISRRALVVTAAPFGWQVDAVNRNGAVLHAWGQPPGLAPSTGMVNWPLVAVRMLPDTANSQHWVLIEAEDVPVTPTGPVTSTDLTETDHVEPPGQLPSGEREALVTVFRDHLSWPPTHPLEALLLKQAANRLGLSISGMQDRLKAARGRAARLGAPTSGGLTDPSYVYALVRAGYLEPPSAFPHRPATH